MDSVRTVSRSPARVCDRIDPPTGGYPSEGDNVLDIVYIAGVIALFALVALIGKAVEKL